MMPSGKMPTDKMPTDKWFDETEGALANQPKRSKPLPTPPQTVVTNKQTPVTNNNQAAVINHNGPVTNNPTAVPNSKNPFVNRNGPPKNSAEAKPLTQTQSPPKLPEKDYDLPFLQEPKPGDITKQKMNLPEVPGMGDATWAVYTLKIEAATLNSWCKSAWSEPAGGFYFDEGIDLPIKVTIWRGVYQYLIQDANWVAKLTKSASAAADAVTLIVKSLLETQTDCIKAKGEDAALKEIDQAIAAALKRFETELGQQFADMVNEYVKTFEKLQKYRAKLAFQLVANTAKFSIHVAHSTSGVTAILGGPSAFKNFSQAASTAKKLFGEANPEALEDEIEGKFWKIHQDEKDRDAKLQYEASKGTETKGPSKPAKDAGYLGQAKDYLEKKGKQTIEKGKEVRKNYKEGETYQKLKKLIKEHEMLISQMITAQHDTGKHLAEAKDEREKKKLQALVDEYERRIQRQKQVHEHFVKSFEDLDQDDSTYKAVTTVVKIAKCGYTIADHLL
jgi:hypothetical protein